METIGITLGIAGGLLGISAFFGEWLVALFKYLYIDVRVLKAEAGKRKYSARIIFENRGVLRKRVDYAALLISPENESTESTIQQIAESIKSPELLAKDVNYLRSRLIEPQYLSDGQRAIIPLPFIFLEQKYIAEQTACSCLLDTTKLANKKVYSLKLYILERFLFGVRRRVVHELLFID